MKGNEAGMCRQGTWQSTAVQEIVMGSNKYISVVYIKETFHCNYSVYTDDLSPKISK